MTTCHRPKNLRHDESPRGNRASPRSTKRAGRGGPLAIKWHELAAADEVHGLDYRNQHNRSAEQQLSSYRERRLLAIAKFVFRLPSFSGVRKLVHPPCGDCLDGR
jgi:hypothetical protein